MQDWQASVHKHHSDAYLKKHRDSHHNMSLHKPPLCAIDPSRYILCLLHMLLNIVAKFWKDGILSEITDDAQAKRINDFLERERIWIRLLIAYMC